MELLRCLDALFYKQAAPLGLYSYISGSHLKRKINACVAKFRLERNIGRKQTLKRS